ncbi:unnamed protein product, partial [Larinioides sclopetarius]
INFRRGELFVSSLLSCFHQCENYRLFSLEQQGDLLLLSSGVVEDNF